MTDLYAILGVELILAGLVLISILQPLRRNNGISIQVKRGPESRRRFGIAYGFGSVLLLQVINSSAAFTGHKVLLSLANLAALFYLCFFSGWFRNKIVGWIGRWEKRPER